MTWPGSDVAILAILAFLALLSFALVRQLRRQRLAGAPLRSPRVNYVRTFGAFWWDFIVGDDWRVALGVSVGLAVSRPSWRIEESPLGGFSPPQWRLY